MTPYIHSIQTGKVQKLEGWETASFKKEVKSAKVQNMGIEGDEVSDTKNHGGIEKAVFANSLENYAGWCEFLNADSLEEGSLGENLTISGLNETNVYLGDIHQIGEVILQVVQPRKPCWKISKKHNNKAFAQLIYSTGKTGWYYKVIKEGNIQKKDKIFVLSIQKSNKLHRYINNQKVSILDANKAFKDPKHNQLTLKKILTITGLSEKYKESIKKRLQGTYDLSFMEMPHAI
jgi:MOSC domain-containing protein YiiM